jgi:hypothetical protein
MQELKDQTFLSNLRLGLDVDRFLRGLHKEVNGIKTGIDRLDSQLLGLAGFVGIIGEPKACKSTLALQIAAYNASQGNPVYFIDQENGKSRLSQRLLCNLHNLSWGELKRLPNAGRLYEQLSQLPLYCHFGKADIETIDFAVHDMFSKHKNKHALLIVDSLQSVARNLTDLRMSIDQWLLDLDGLKLKYDGQLTIIIICEKRRGAYGVAATDSAKESGRIEYKIEQQLDLRNQDGQIIIECTLNRDGPKGVQVPLIKMLKNPANEHSFTFRLQEEERVGF